MAGITQNRQKCIIFIVFPQLRNADESGLVEKKKKNKDINNNNVIEALNSPSDNSICSLV